MDFLNYLPIKPRKIATVFVIATVISGIRAGYFKRVIAFVRQISWKKYLKPALFLLAIFALVLFLDQRILQWVQEGKDRFGIRELLRLGAMLNHNSEFWVLLTSAYWSGFVFSSPGFRKNAFAVFASSALTGLVGNIFKFVFFRARPYSAEGPFSWFNFDTGDAHAYQSLPSGDVLLTGGLAASLFFQAKNKWLFLPVFILPIASAVQRVVADKHWPSDTFVSMSMGLFFAHCVIEYKKFCAEEKKI